MPSQQPIMLHVFLGELRTGLWCPACLLPSGVEVEIFLVSWAGVKQAGAVRCCADCRATLEGENLDV